MHSIRSVLLASLSLLALAGLLLLSACAPVKQEIEEQATEPDTPPPDTVAPAPETPGTVEQAENLKERYARLKADYAAQFNPPALNRNTQVKLKSGVEKEGRLTGLTDDTLTLEIDAGTLTYDKGTLDTQTRLRFFREDYAAYHARQALRKEELEIRKARAATSPSTDPASSDTLSSSPPVNDRRDASVQQVKDYLERNLRHPESVQFIEWSRVLKHEKGYSVRCKYSVKTDGFGRITENKVFFMNKNGKVIRVSGGTQKL